MIHGQDKQGHPVLYIGMGGKGSYNKQYIHDKTSLVVSAQTFVFSLNTSETTKIKIKKAIVGSSELLITTFMTLNEFHV